MCLAKFVSRTRRTSDITGLGWWQNRISWSLSWSAFVRVIVMSALTTVFSFNKVYKIHKTGTVRPPTSLLSTRMPFHSAALWRKPFVRHLWSHSIHHNSSRALARYKQTDGAWNDDSMNTANEKQIFPTLWGKLGAIAYQTSTNDQTGMVIWQGIIYTDVMTLCFRTRVPRRGPSGAGTMEGCRVGAGGTMTSTTVGTLPSADGLILSIVAVVSSSAGTKGRRNRRLRHRTLPLANLIR